MKKLFEGKENITGPLKEMEGWHYNGYNDIFFVCPKCGFEYVHITKINSWEERDKYELGFTIEGYCENSHKFKFDFENHKGNTRLFNYESRDLTKEEFILYHNLSEEEYEDWYNQ